MVDLDFYAATAMSLSIFPPARIIALCTRRFFQFDLPHIQAVILNQQQDEEWLAKNTAALVSGRGQREEVAPAD